MFVADTTVFTEFHEARRAELLTLRRPGRSLRRAERPGQPQTLAAARPAVESDRVAVANGRTASSA